MRIRLRGLHRSSNRNRIAHSCDDLIAYSFGVSASVQHNLSGDKTSTWTYSRRRVHWPSCVMVRYR